VALFDRYEQEKEEEAFAVFQLTWMGDGPNSIAQGRHYMEQEIVPLFPQREHTHTTFFDFSWSKISQESEQLPWATSIRATQGWNGFLMPRNNTQFIWDNIQASLSSLLSDCPHLSPNIELWGGAISDVASNDTAFAHREAVYNVGVVLMVPNGTENLQQVFQDQVNKVSQVWPLIANYLSGAYVNYPMASLANKAYAAEYWGSNLKRLVEIKRKYDPINAFSYQQSVPLHPKSMAAQLARN
jgi:FAD/FMN-containing dehydrogenase